LFAQWRPSLLARPGPPEFWALSINIEHFALPKSQDKELNLLGAPMDDFAADSRAILAAAAAGKTSFADAGNAVS
jgi:hypothetical protein